jgi:hypothetical protein
MNYTFDFIRNGSSLTGKTNNSQFGASEIQEGKINGDEISFVEMMDSSIRVEYKGRRAGDEIRFVRKVGDFGTEAFVAKRVK